MITIINPPSTIYMHVQVDGKNVKDLVSVYDKSTWRVDGQSVLIGHIGGSQEDTELNCSDGDFIILLGEWNAQASWKIIRFHNAELLWLSEPRDNKFSSMSGGAVFRVRPSWWVEYQIPGHHRHSCEHLHVGDSDAELFRYSPYTGHPIPFEFS